jgi:hypothetical protein
MEASSQDEHIYEPNLSKLCAQVKRQELVKRQEFQSPRFHQAVIAGKKCNQWKGLAASHKQIVTKLLLRLHLAVEEFPYNQTGSGD